MRKFMFVGLAGSIAFAAAGCSSQSSGNVAATSSPNSASDAETPATTQPFEAKTEPMVAQVAPPETNIPGLIQATNGDERARQVQRSIRSQKREDPFAGLSPELQQARPVSYRPDSPLVRRLPTIPTASIPRFTTRRPRAATTALKPQKRTPSIKQLPAKPRPTTTALKPTTPMPPQREQASPVIKTLPPLPSADLANAVEVSGVVMVGKATQVILKAPYEATSRYVQPGQRLSNGRVLVKRVEMAAGIEPVVILEENGIEVAKTLGVLTQAANPV